MIPRAKIVSLWIAPPENKFIMPKIVPPCCSVTFSKKTASAEPSIPGVGMKVPKRYTMIIPKVKNIFLRIPFKRSIYHIIRGNIPTSDIFFPSGLIPVSKPYDPSLVI